MKLSSFVILILLISGIFFAYAEMIKEANDQYPDVNINSSEWDVKFDFIDDVNNTVSPLEEKLKVVQDPDRGFFVKVAALITAIPFALIVFPEVILGTMVFGSKIIVEFFIFLNIPGKISVLALTILLVFILFKLVEFYNKQQV